MTDHITPTNARQALIDRLLRPSTHSKESSIPETRRIVPTPKGSFYPASYAQNRIYVLHQLSPSSLNYNLPFAVILEGTVDLDRFHDSLDKLSQRHEALRTGFQIIDGQLVQILDDSVNVDINIQPLHKDEIASAIKKFAQPFHLSRAPLFRVSLLTFSDHPSILLLDMHHIISDGTSLTILIEDFFHLYHGNPKPVSLIQHKDYAVWEQQWFSSEQAEQQLAFWKNQFENLPPALSLPTDYARPLEPTYQGDSLSFTLDTSLHTKLKTLAAKANTSLFILLLAIYKVFLHKYSQQNDLVTGVPVAGRMDPSLQKVVGLFVNTLAIRTQVIETQAFSEFLSSMHKTVTSCLTNQQYPFEKIVEQLQIPRENNRNPLFDTMFTMQNMQKSIVESKHFTFKPYQIEYKTANFDLEVYANETPEGIHFRFEYSTELFTSNTAQLMADAFCHITESIVDNPNSCISFIQSLSPTETLKQLQHLTGPAKTFDFQNFQQHFEAICEQFPTKTAAIFNEQQLSYQQLNLAVNQFAQELSQLKEKPEPYVCVLMDRSIDFLIVMMAILKSGSVYVPIDPILPPERAKLILESMPGCIIVTETPYLEMAQSIGQQQTILCFQQLPNQAMSNPPSIIHPKQLAYVIFTSGSTGVPKGAMVEHLGMLNHLYAKAIDLQLTEKDVVAQNATQSFDVSVWQFFVALIQGGTVVVFDKNKAWEPQALIDEIQRTQVTVFETVPSHVLVILDFLEQLTTPPNLSSLRWLMVNGEPLTSDICRRWFKLYKQIPIVNAYGPTECSDDVTHQRLLNNLSFERAAVVPLGRTIINHRLYVLDKHLQPVPPGVVGELYISGTGVGRGYLKSPAKTAVTFLPDLFSPEPGKRMYKTGDLVRCLGEGQGLIFLGRKDHQIKIRGHRIEIQEIEKALLSFPECKECLVSVHKESDGTLSLCAYVKIDSQSTKEALKNHIKNILPAYMLPTYIELVEQFPLLINGKIDRKKLPAPLAEQQNIHLVAPTTSLEKELQQLWAEVLDLPKSSIGIHQHFFELGGTSLKAIKLISRIRLKLGFQIAFTDIFKYPTIAEMIHYKSSTDNHDYANLTPYPAQAFYPATVEQSQLFKEHKQYPDKTVYNMPYELTLGTPLDLQKANQALQELANRHDVLSMSFVERDGQIYLVESNNIDLSIQHSLATESDLDRIRQAFIQPYNLSSPPLLRMLLVNTGQQSTLLLDCHAILADLISRQILIREFFDLYLGKTLPAQPLAYKDYLLWKNMLINSDAMLPHRYYWENKLSKAVGGLKSPESQQLTHKNSIAAERTMLALDESFYKNLEKLAHRLEVTPHILCFAFFAILLQRFAEEELFCIISPVAERDNPKLENLVGMLVNTLPIPILVQKEKNTFIQYVNEIKDSLFTAYNHQHYPAIERYHALLEEKNHTASGYFDATFVWGETQGKSFSDMTSFIEERAFEQLPPRFDLRLEAFVVNSGLRLMFEARASLFSSQSLQQMAKMFEQIFNQVQINPFIQVSELKQ